MGWPLWLLGRVKSVWWWRVGTVRGVCWVCLYGC